ncbi:MAG TPA: hypothetical protein VFE24_13605 [Pirellulales bacterium]|jgi:hypothetical protein|nr:hypothetical protein [Pirellulales bacterium]
MRFVVLASHRNTSSLAPRTTWSTRVGQNSDARGPFLKSARAIFQAYDLGYLLCGEENLSWAVNADHSTAYCKAVAETLEAASIKGGQEAVLKALNQIGDFLMKNPTEPFRGLPGY